MTKHRMLCPAASGGTYCTCDRRSSPTDIARDKAEQTTASALLPERMNAGDLEALEIMVEIFGTEQMLRAMEIIAKRRAVGIEFMGGMSLNSVQAKADRSK